MKAEAVETWPLLFRFATFTAPIMETIKLRKDD